jgi:hypothetical protein
MQGTMPVTARQRRRAIRSFRGLVAAIYRQEPLIRERYSYPGFESHPAPDACGSPTRALFFPNKCARCRERSGSVRAICPSAHIRCRPKEAASIRRRAVFCSPGLCSTKQRREGMRPPEQFRQRATEALAMAERARNADQQEAFQEIATRYLALAKYAEKLLRPSPSSAKETTGLSRRHA